MKFSFPTVTQQKKKNTTKQTKNNGIDDMSLFLNPEKKRRFTGRSLDDTTGK